MPSLRPVLPLFDFTASRWGSSIRLRPRHVQRFLSYGTKSEKKRFPYYTERRDLPREALLRRLSFPREYMPYWSGIWWTTRHIPILSIRPILLIRLCLYLPLRMWNLPMANKGVIGNSCGARLFYVLCIIDLLNIVMQPWGLILLGEGPSMQPTFPARHAPIYASYAYFDRRDVRRGDVVVVMPPERYEKQGLICKRIAALGGERIRVTRYGSLKIPRKIIHVRFYHIISFFSSVFTYSHYRYRSDTAFWLGIIL